ncbi:MAG: sigma-70 family RNA polymerase sigma factor [Myxococcota bacterium]|nr:sigma-70 family RNA polymerase sigma factor [Myxococcota bacterium]
MEQEDPDVVLMLAFRDGDEGAFDQLFRRWAGPLLRYLERMLGDSAVAEELVQEAFFRVHRARDRYEARARFSTWLYRIATNLALNELKRPRRRHVHEDEERINLRAGGPGADDLLASRRLGVEMERELEKLPERQRMALWLSAAEGHSYAEVASILETSEKSVKALVHRARVALVSRMSDCVDSMGSVSQRGTA